MLNRLKSTRIYKSGTDGYVLEVSGNKLIQGGKGAEVVNYLGECLNGLQFRPVSINASTDPCRESGDLAVIIDSKGNKYKTIFTNVNYVAHRAQALICGAEVPTRLSSTRYSQATQVYKEVRANIRKYRNEWSAAFKELQTAMDSKNGLFPVSETQEDGSTILYFCDKPALKDSSTVIKLSARGWGMSTDGGKTWNVGTLVDGTTITKILNTVGINADWINTGALTVKDDDGNIVLSVDASTGKLITKLAEIAGWNVNENAIYKDVTIDSDSYRVYFQPPNTNSGKNTWVFSIQKKINNSYQGLAVIRADGSILSYSEEFNARIEMRHGVLSFIKDGVERGKISISSDGSEFVIYLTDPNAEGAGQELSARSLKECHGGLVSRYWSNASIGTGTDNDKWTVVPAFSTTNDDNIKKSGFISRSNTQVIIQKKGVYQFVVRLAVKSSRANKRCNFAPFVNGERYSSYTDTAYSPTDAWYTSLKTYTLELEKNDRVDFRAAPIESISVSLQIYDVNIFVLDYEGKYSI